MMDAIMQDPDWQSGEYVGKSGTEDGDDKVSMKESGTATSKNRSFPEHGMSAAVNAQQIMLSAPVKEQVEEEMKKDQAEEAFKSDNSRNHKSDSNNGGGDSCVGIGAGSRTVTRAVTPPPVTVS